MEGINRSLKFKGLIKQDMKGYIIRWKDYNRLKDRPYVYLVSHASYPVWKPEREEAKVFNTLDEVEQFKEFWNKQIKGYELTVINLDEELV